MFASLGKPLGGGAPEAAERRGGSPEQMYEEISQVVRRRSVGRRA